MAQQPKDSYAAVAVSVGGRDWTCVPAAADAVGAGVLDGFASEAILRDLPGRRVEKADGAALGPVVIKTYQRSRTAGLHRSAAWREWERLRKAESLGLPVPAALAVSAGPRWDRLVLRWLPGRDLRTTWETDAPPSWQEIAAFANFVRSLHDRGLVHRDFHPGNILVKSRGDAPSFTLLDGRGFHFYQSITAPHRLAALAVLNLYFFIRAPRHVRWRFFKAYAKGLDLPGGLTVAAAGVEAQTARLARAMWRRRARRHLGDGRHYIAFSEPGLRGIAAAGEAGEAARSAAATLFERGGEVIKDSRGALSTLRRAGERTLFCKVSRPRDGLEAFRERCRRPRAFRTWCTALACRDRNLPVPEPVLAAVRTLSGSGGASLLCTEALLDTDTLDRALKGMDVSGRRVVVGTLARATADFHDRGVSHRDLKAANVLVVRNVGKVYICDLDGARIRGKVPKTRRIRDLTRTVRTLREDCDGTDDEIVGFVRAYLLRTAGNDRDLPSWLTRIDRCRQEGRS